MNVDEQRWQAVVNAVAQQRDAALNSLANAAGQIAVLEAEIDRLKAKELNLTQSNNGVG
jgi:uncharacterized small protein (DUF1192 family)